MVRTSPISNVKIYLPVGFCSLVNCVWIHNHNNYIILNLRAARRKKNIKKSVVGSFKIFFIYKTLVFYKGFSEIILAV